MRTPLWFVGLILVLVAVAGLFSLLIEDIDTFEARTGLFERMGTWFINGLVGLVGVFCVFWTASFFFPKRWGPKAGIGGAIVCTLVALFCFRILWLGGA